MIGGFSSTGALGALSVKADKTASGGSIDGATITATKIASILTGKNVTNARIFAGAILGADGTLGGIGADADTFGPGTIGPVNIGGNVVASAIAAGFTTTNAILKDGDDAIFGATPADQIKNTIASLIIKGTADPASYFAAGKFNAKPKIGAAFPDIATDLRFVVP